MNRLLVLVALLGMLRSESVVAQIIAEDHVTVKIQQFGKSWSAQGWNAPDKGNRKYLRSLDDDSWKLRMLVLRETAGRSEDVVAQLLEALKSENDGVRILAAQALGYTAVAPPTETIVEHIKRDGEIQAVQLYLVDTLGMHGVADIPGLLKGWRASGRDLRKHLQYAKERDGARVELEIVQAIQRWNPADADSATVGQAAPDFELTDLNGETIKLSDYRGQKAVVLTFVYGDT